MNEWYRINNIEELDSPALVVFPARVKQNIQTAISMVGNADRLRPHIKTNKSPDVAKLMLEAGITKFKCATIAEAEMLAMVDAPDVLLAYQPLGPKLKRFIGLIKKYPRTKFSCLVDNPDAAKEQAKAFEENKITGNVYVDLNVGMNRTGIAPGEEAIKLCQYCSSSPGLHLAGLHVYDGQLRNPDITARTKESDEGIATVEKLIDELSAKRISIKNIVAGGSPAFPIHTKRKNVECSPGTFVYWDKTYLDNCPEQNFLPAAVIITRIISMPSAGKICTDLGHKSIASENEISKRIYFLNVEGMRPVSHSEEHFVLQNVNNHELKTGDLLYGIPYHICPTVALYERTFIVEDGKVTGEWKTIARDRKLSV